MEREADEARSGGISAGANVILDHACRDFDERIHVLVRCLDLAGGQGMLFQLVSPLQDNLQADHDAGKRPHPHILTLSPTFEEQHWRAISERAGFVRPS